jgi:hypothetical protein
VLGPLCPEALRALFDYSIVIRDRGYGRYDGNLDALADAAKQMLSCYYEAIPRPSATPLDWGIACELAGARMWARQALSEKLNDKAVKEIELATANGRPLSICVGGSLVLSSPPAGFTYRGMPKRPQFKFLEVRVIQRGEARTLLMPYRGCRRVFPDTTQTERWAWAYLCERCKPRHGGRVKQKREHDRVATSLLS